MSEAYAETLFFDAKLIEERDYWLKRLSTELETSNLTPDFERQETNSARKDTVEIGLTRPLREKIALLTKGSAFLLYTTLAAGLKTCLSKYAGNDKIVIGSPALKELDRANALVIVDEVDPDMTFRQLLLNVRETLLEAYSRQRYQFGNVLKNLGLDAVQNRCPLFDVALSLTDIHGDMPPVHNDITITFSNLSDGLTGLAEFDPAIFKRETVERFLTHYTNALRQALENVDTKLSEIQILSDAEREQILFDWNNTASEYPADRCIHELFESQVERTPGGAAAVFEGKQLSYAELNARANQLARYLKAQGAGPGVLVAICMERSIEMLAGLIGILKSGAAYVPMDPQYPKEQLAFRLMDTQAPVLLTQQRLSKDFLDCGVRVVCIDGDWSEIAKENIENLYGGAAPENLAYVIYTSGSTGKPKGVRIPHRALVNHSFAIASRYCLDSRDRVLQFASSSFDVAAEEIFPSLIAGAAVIFRPEAVLSSFAGLSEFVESEALSVINLPTTYWQEWVKSLSASGNPLPESLRLVVIGSEKASPFSYPAWLKLGAERARLINAYGTSETAITSLVFEPSATSQEQAESIHLPIGKPIANTQAYLLDSTLQPVPVGVCGELYIGGEGLAHGYSNQAETTALKFIPDPFSKESGARLYKTGDLARYRADGNVEYVGRVDHQVKLHGFRIELGEVELALACHPSVLEAVVVMAGHEQSNEHLVAYVVPNRGANPVAGELRGFLREKLPDYMVPSAFMMLDKLPLTPNGKVDQRALPAHTGGAETEGAFQAPRTPIEEVVAGIWCGALQLDKVSVNANFFELGGHSLSATQVLSRARQTFNVDIALRTFFQAPTVADLAQAIEHARRAGRGLIIPSIKRVSRDRNFPLSFAQTRLWFIDQLEPGNCIYNCPDAIRITGNLDVAVLEQSFNRVIERHEILRTKFATVNGQPFQVIAPSHKLRLSVIDLTQLTRAVREEAARRLTAEEAQRPFNLATGPLFRALVLRLDEEEHVVLATTHHIISDAWSVSILVREVVELYTAACEGRPSPLPPLPIQYADYACWQQEWLRDGALKTQLDYWLNRLEGSPGVLRLPLDRPRPPINSYRSSTLTFGLPTDMAGAISDLSRKENVTLFMMFLSAFNVLLNYYSDQQDIVVGSPVATRSNPETEGLIGFFTNTLVFRTDLSGNPTFRELLGRVRETCLDAYANQDMPFERLVRELQPGRNLSHTPLFQVSFAVQNVPPATLELSGLTITPVGSRSGASPFDLILSIVEQPQEIAGTLQYNTDLFNAATIKRMSENFETLLAGIVAQPDARLDELREVLIKADRQKHGLRDEELKKARLEKFGKLKWRAATDIGTKEKAGA